MYSSEIATAPGRQQVSGSTVWMEGEEGKVLGKGVAAVSKRIKKQKIQNIT